MNDIMQSMYRASPSVLARIVDDYKLRDNLFEIYSQQLHDAGDDMTTDLAEWAFGSNLHGYCDGPNGHKGLMFNLLVLLTYRLLERGDIGAVEQWDIFARLKKDKDARFDSILNRNIVYR